MKKAADILNEEKDKILDSWEKAVKKEIPAANFTERLVLRDHIPNLIGDISDVMYRIDKMEVIRDKEHFKEIYRNSVEHGRQRSSSSGFTVDQILREYIIFHRILTEVLEEEKGYSSEVGKVLKYAVENAMLFSVTAFSDSLQEMRQKLIGVLAHDMRNPISAAYTAIGIIDKDLGEDQIEHLKQMARSSLKRSLDLIEGLLDSVMLQAGEGIFMNFSKADLVEIITAIYQDAERIYSNEIKLECHEKQLKGVIDEVMLRRVLENLISNAVKYGDWNKPITILAENLGEKVKIQVHNYGNPIPEEKQKQIFHFLNTSNNDNSKGLKSYGMGLSLVSAVVQAHSGIVEIKSNRKEGTTFSMTLSLKNSPGKRRVALRLP